MRGYMIFILTKEKKERKRGKRGGGGGVLYNKGIYNLIGCY
jgi:hypothetical protein